MKPTTLPFALLALSAASFFAGCGTTDGEGACADNDRSQYPTAPYGHAEGDTLTDLNFVRSDGNPLSLSQIHEASNNKLLLLTTAAGWCTACIEEQPVLEELYGLHRDAGLEIIVGVFEDGDHAPATAAVANAWRRQYGLSFPVVADTEFVLGDYYDSTLTPMTMMVDVPCMQILSLETGFDRNRVEALIEARL